MTPLGEPSAPQTRAPQAQFAPGGTDPELVEAMRSSLAAILDWYGLRRAPTSLGMTPDHDGQTHATERPDLLVPIGPGESDEGLAELRAQVAALAADMPDSADLLLRTSGSTTGHASLIAMSAHALAASALATHDFLGGPGAWVVALPVHHVAGLQMVVRSLLADRPAYALDATGGFQPQALAGLLRTACAEQERVYVSLVPTQLVRCLDDPDTATALSLTHGVLVGGAATDPTLYKRSMAAGIPVRRTYGMSETGGGCVYDGIPLRGVQVSIEHPDDEGEGRICLAGPMLAEAILPAASGSARLINTPQGRLLRTADRGILADGVLSVRGRIDDVIVSGGIKVEPREVEEALTSLPGVGEACVVGVPDPQWGQAVIAVVTPSHGVHLDPEAVRTQVRMILDGAHSPKFVIVRPSLPTRGPGKVDRRAVRALALREYPPA